MRNKTLSASLYVGYLAGFYWLSSLALWREPHVYHWIGWVVFIIQILVVAVILGAAASFKHTVFTRPPHLITRSNLICLLAFIASSWAGRHDYPLNVLIPVATILFITAACWVYKRNRIKWKAAVKPT